MGKLDVLELEWDTTAVVNIKGGPGKTTTAMHLGASLVEDGNGSVVVIDGDMEQGSAQKWVREFMRSHPGEAFPFDVVTPDLLVGEWRWYVVDTPPHDAGAVSAALLEADLAVVPVSPTMMDLAQVPDTQAAIEAARRENPKLRVAYLLTKVRYGTLEAREGRQALEEDLGLPLLRTEIPLWQSVSRTFGELPDVNGPYAAVLDELKEIMR
jgi:chromosome partitioning protein